MIRTDDDFQPTMWAVQSDDHWPPRRQYGNTFEPAPARKSESFDGDTFGNPIAAHAASEYDEPDTHEDSGGSIVWPLVVGVALLGAVILGAHFGASL